MKRTAVGALLVSLVAASAAMAGQGFRGIDQRDPRPVAQDDRRDWDRGERHDSHHEDRHDDRRGSWHSDHRDDHYYQPAPPRYVFRPAPPPPHYAYRPVPPRYGTYYPPRDYYVHTWRRGDRLPPAFYARPYLIEDYRGCGLREPPRGYHWVRVEDDAVLAAVATGVVLETVFHLF